MRPLLRFILHGSLRGTAANHGSPMYAGNSHGTKNQNGRRLGSFGSGGQAAADKKMVSSHTTRIYGGLDKSMDAARVEKNTGEWIELRE